jgi:hypothetical protein
MVLPEPFLQAQSSKRSIYANGNFTVKITISVSGFLSTIHRWSVASAHLSVMSDNLDLADLDERAELPHDEAVNLNHLACLCFIEDIIIYS